MQQGRFHAPATNGGFTFTAEDIRIKDGTLLSSPCGAPDVPVADDAMETSVMKPGATTAGMWELNNF